MHPSNIDQPPLPTNPSQQSFIIHDTPSMSPQISPNVSRNNSTSTSLRNLTRPIPNFNYSESTLIVHESAKQASALEKLEEKVMEKLQQRNPHPTKQTYELLEATEFSDDERDDNIPIRLVDEATEEYEQQITRHKEKVFELEMEIDKLSLKITASERDKQAKLKAKDDEIAKLRKEIKELREIQAQNPRPSLNATPGPSGLGVSFSLSLNQDISDMDSNMDSNYETTTDDDQKTGSSKLGIKKKKSTKHHYDNVSEQIEILNNEKLKNKSLELCLEEPRISKSGTDKGIIMFFTKYLQQKTVDQIFSKAGKTQKSDPNYISSASGLVNVLSFAVILYKVKAYQVVHSDTRPRINNADIKNTVKYLSIWIVRTYGIKKENKYYDNKTNKRYDVYDFKLSKQDFSTNIIKYLKVC